MSFFFTTASTDATGKFYELYAKAISGILNPLWGKGLGYITVSVNSHLGIS